MATGKTTVTKDGDSFYYYFRSNGTAYINAFVDGCIYGPDGTRLNAEDGSTNEVKQIVGIDGLDNVSQVIVSRTGRIRRSGTVRIDGVKWTVTNYQANLAEDQD